MKLKLSSLAKSIESQSVEDVELVNTSANESKRENKFNLG